MNVAFVSGQMKIYKQNQSQIPGIDGTVLSCSSELFNGMFHGKKTIGKQETPKEVRESTIILRSQYRTSQLAIGWTETHCRYLDYFHKGRHLFQPKSSIVTNV